MSIEYEPKNKKLIQKLIDIKQQLIADIQQISGVGFYIFRPDASYKRLDGWDKALQVTLIDLQVNKQMYNCHVLPFASNLN